MQEPLIIIAVLVSWLVLSVWILPKFGINT
jgi:hypothetical protein